MESISRQELLLINSLSSRTYSGNSLLSNATENERDQLKEIKVKLKQISQYFAKKYSSSYGPFETSVSTGNPIAIGGTRFNRVWSGIFKGASNKQYAAQISFVMNPNECCLDVGFYFGRASAHSKSKSQRTALENQLKILGTTLANTIENDSNFRDRYNSLFDFGFKSSHSKNEVLGDDWIDVLRSKTKNSQIIAKIYPNDFGIIENSTIDSYVSQVIFLMGGIQKTAHSQVPIIKPLTPEQRAKEAERFAQIGLKGELFVMEKERSKLASLKIKKVNYPRHVALESMAYGYDILSLDEFENEIFIEVKTTTRSKKDKASKEFYLSSNEYDFFEKNKSGHRLFRVYDIDNEPSIDSIDLNRITKKTDGYICRY